MAKAALKDLEYQQFDVTNAFLNSTINKASGRIYVRLPEGMADLGLLKPNKHTGMVAKLDKALYGLKNAPLLWFKEFTKTLRDINLQQSAEEPCIFMNEYVIILFYVNDILVFYKIEHKTQAQRIITQIKNRYNIRNDGAVKWFLGVKITKNHNAKRIFLTHNAYIEKVARRFALNNNASIPAIPIPIEKHLLRKNPLTATHAEVHIYQELVESIIYTVVTIRPNVAWAAALLSRFLTNPSH
jgi:hypothetical protein